jgi:hypothetical protein
MVVEHIIILLVDLSQNLTFVHLLIIEVGTLTPSWAIFNAFAHLTFAPTWEKWVISDQI